MPHFTRFTRRGRLATYQVMALFADNALSFGLSTGATFADLADRLEQLGERHMGMPTAIYLKRRIGTATDYRRG